MPTLTVRSTLGKPAPEKPAPPSVKRLHLSLAVILAMFIAGLLHASWFPRAAKPPPDPAAIIGRALFLAYDPIVNADLLQARLAHKCDTHIPTPDAMARHPYRNKWALSRFAAYHNIHLYLRQRWANRTAGNTPNLKLLDVGGSRFLEPFKDVIDVTLTSYPGTDMHRTQFAENTFDVIASDQVLEHTFLPHMVFLEMHRILKPGGIAIMTTVSYNPVHDAGNFHDLWRFMEDGLRVLSMPFKGGIKMCGSWGTAKAISARAQHGMGSLQEDDIFRTGFNRMLTTNEPINPFLVWIVVEK